MINQSTSGQSLPAPQGSPTHAFAPIQREFNRLFDQLGSGWESFADLSLIPRMDLRDTKKALELTVELPGMTRDDVMVAIEDNILTVNGEKRAEWHGKEENCRFSERSYGTFSRSVTLPRSIEAGKIKATMDNGVLKIVAPKDGKSAVKTIDIQTQ